VRNKLATGIKGYTSYRLSRLISGEKNMTATSRRERVKLNASTENEKTTARGTRTPSPALKQNKAVGAKSAESAASVKTSQSVTEKEKPRQPVRQAKVANEPTKAARATKAAKVGEADKAVKTVKTARTSKIAEADNAATASKKNKLRRDSYSIPESEHKQIAVLKKRCMDQGTPIKKSYLLRAGLQVLTLMDDDELVVAVARVK
jgi:hypothetical protein